MTLNPLQKTIATLGFITFSSLVIAYVAMGLHQSGLSSPFIYDHLDDIWQFSLTKVLKETGWILSNPYLGAPEVAHWHYHSAAQTSALHSIIMLAMSPFFDSAITLQQTYYILNFPLIGLTTYLACRLLSIARLPAICAALLYAFCTYRFNFVIYSFLSNYFTIPLVMVSIVWVMQGKFDSLLKAPTLGTALATLLKNKSFLLGLVFIVLVALADGYYAFFSLLLFGCAGVIRLAVGGWRRPRLLIPVILYGFTLIFTSLAIQAPLYQYKKAHHDEFYPNNIPDPALNKQPFEAEVYSSSLKLLLTPTPNHHIAHWGAVGGKVLETTNSARRFPTFTVVPLGIIGSLLLLIAFAALIIPQLKRALFTEHRDEGDHSNLSLSDSLLAVTFFVFLCSISGGIGSLVALVFPTIRAYDRYPIFMMLALLLLGALLASRALARTGYPKLVAGMLVAVTAFGLYDQIPANVAGRNPDIRPRVAAETAFVQELESKVAPGSMVYQYPYSQYLSDNKYYGWGSFAHIRLYLFSRTLHWSNGGPKNSPADDWNQRISKLPVDELLSEIRALGFKAFVVDRTVIKDEEYAALKQALLAQQISLTEEPTQQLAYALLPPSNMAITYAPDYKSLDSLTLHEPPAKEETRYPELVNSEQLRVLLATSSPVYPLRIERQQHPEIFQDLTLLRKGSGDFALTPITDFKATLHCNVPDEQKRIALDFTNNNPYSVTFGQGPFPIALGVHIKGPDDAMLLWDAGYRIAPVVTVKPGETRRFIFNPDDFSPGAKFRAQGSNTVQFEMVQDGNAWFSSVSCSSSL